LSAEKRFTTTVPLQRLFFMNSDFMQQQGELLARRVMSEPDSGSRLQKSYRLIFGRAATDAEVRAGLDYLGSEPLKAYDERKQAAKDGAKDSEQGGEQGVKKDVQKDADKNADKSAEKDASGEAPADDMMAGVLQPSEERKGSGDDSKKLLPVTVWGRYLKVLLSSSEFVFVN
jgi:hypothetical protein